MKSLISTLLCCFFLALPACGKLPVQAGQEEQQVQFQEVPLLLGTIMQMKERF